MAQCRRGGGLPPVLMRPTPPPPPRYLSKLGGGRGGGGGGVGISPGGGGDNGGTAGLGSQGGGGGANTMQSPRFSNKVKCCHGVSLGCTKGAEQGPNTSYCIQLSIQKKFGAVGTMAPGTTISQNLRGG